MEVQVSSGGVAGVAGRANLLAAIDVVVADTLTLPYGMCTYHEYVPSWWLTRIVFAGHQAAPRAA